MHRRSLLALCGLFLALPIPGCGPAPAADELVDASEKLTLIEGLPHPIMGGPAFDEAKAGPRPNADRWGHRFYDDAVPISPEVEAKLRAFLGDPMTFRKFGGEKKCGGFHPDFAVEHGDKVDLLCFGCGEVIVAGKSGMADGPTSKRFDLSPTAKDELKKLLEPLARGPKPAGEAAAAAR